MEPAANSSSSLLVAATHAVPHEHGDQLTHQPFCRTLVSAHIQPHLPISKLPSLSVPFSSINLSTPVPIHPTPPPAPGRAGRAHNGGTDALRHGMASIHTSAPRTTATLTHQLLKQPATKLAAK